MSSLLTTQTILDLLKTQLTTVGPIQISILPSETQHRELDAVVMVEFDDQRFLFAGEIKNNSNPKTLEAAAHFIKRFANLQDLHPLVIAPWLSEDKLNLLKKIEVNGLDLCGNYLFHVPNRLFLHRTGNTNKFKENRSIQNVYAGESSIISRLFLTYPHFYSINSIKKRIEQRNGVLATSTISKVLKEMSEDLIIEKNNNNIRLIQPEKLISTLKSNYKPPSVIEVHKSRVENPTKTIEYLMAKYPGMLMLSGLSAGIGYTSMGSTDTLSIYSTIPIDKLVRESELSPASRFANLTIIQIKDRFPFFDKNTLKGVERPSLIQTWLEMATSGEKRLMETAEILEREVREQCEIMLEIL